MQQTTLANGIHLIVDTNPSKTVAVEASIGVGSNHESSNKLGISHFLEHMLFTGTKNRPSARELANVVDRLGGSFNGVTSNERTFYYIIILKKHLNAALDVLADMLKSTLFKKQEIEKERKVILDEIKFRQDSPRLYQWELFVKKLFDKHPARNPGVGTLKTIGSINRQDILNYYKKHYTSNNISISIVGDVRLDEVKSQVESYFNLPKREKQHYKKTIELQQKATKLGIEKRDIEHSYFVLGYKAPPRLDKESYALDVVKAILGGGMSCRLFNEIRLKRALAYNVGAEYEANTDFGYFAVYVGTDKKNISLVQKIILKEFQKLQNISDREVEDAKNYIEGTYALENENNQSRASLLNFWHLVKDAELADSYIDNIRKVTKEEIKKVAKKYLHKNHTIVIIEQKGKG